MSVTLVSGDEAHFEVAVDVARMCGTVKSLLDDLGNNGGNDTNGNDTKNFVPLPNVSGPVLEKVIEYLQYHHAHPTPQDESAGDDETVPGDGAVQATTVASSSSSSSSAAAATQATQANVGAPEEDKPKKPKRSEELKGWDKDFISAVNYEMLFALLSASNYLEIKSLLDVCAKMVAFLVKDKDAEGIRKLFNLPPAFTPEQEAELRAEIEKIE